MSRFPGLEGGFMSPFFRISLIVFVLASGGTSAWAGLTFSIDGPGGVGTGPGDPQLVFPEKNHAVLAGNTFSINLKVGADAAGSYGDVEVRLTLPVGVMFQEGTLSGFGPATCLPNPVGSSWASVPVTCVWTQSNFVAQAAIQENTIVLKSVALRQRNGQNAQISGSFGTVGATDPASDVHHIQTRTTAGLAALDASYYAHTWASRYAVVDGVQGSVRQFLIQTSTVNSGLSGGFSSNPIDSFKLRVSLPAGSEGTALRLVPGQTMYFGVVSTTATDLVLGTLAPWTTYQPTYAGGGTPNVYSASGYVLVEVFIPCTRLPLDAAGVDLAITIEDFVSNDANGVNMAPNLINSTRAVSLGNIACADTPLSDNPHTAGLQDPLEGGDTRKVVDTNRDRANAGEPQINRITVNTPVGEPVIWDFFLVDRLPDGFWLPGAAADLSAYGNDDLVSHPDLHYYACNLSGTSLASTLNFTRADLQGALSFSATDPPPATHCTSLNDLTSGPIPSGTTHVIVDGAQRMSASSPRPLPYDPLLYDVPVDDWAGFGMMVVDMRLTFPIGISPNPTTNRVWHHGGFTNQGAPAVFKDLAGSIETFLAGGVDESIQSTSPNGLNGPSSTTNTDPNTWVLEVLQPPVTGRLYTETYQDRTVLLASGVSVTLPNPFFVVFGFEGVGLNLPQNPRFEVTIPPGFDILPARTNPSLPPFDSSKLGAGAGEMIFDRPTADVVGFPACGTAPSSVNYAQTGSAGTGYTLAWTVSDTTPWSLKDDVQGAVARCAGIAVELAPAAGSQFEDGEVVTFTSRLYAQNAPNPAVPLVSLDHTRPIGVSGAIDMTSFGLACHPDGVEVSAAISNTGGKRFTRTGARFALPDGIAAAAITPSFGVTAGPTSFQTATWALSVDVVAGATDELVADFTPLIAGDTVLAPHTTGAFSFVVPWDADDGTLTVIAEAYATAVDSQDNPIDLEQLGTSGASLDPMTCPGRVMLDKRLRSGASLTTMGGVSFTLEGTGFSQTSTTDAVGQLVFPAVPPGTYTLTEIAPALGTGATLTPPFAGSWSTTVTVTALETLSLDVDNVCACAAVTCRAGTCGWDGTTATCAYVATPALACDDGDGNACTSGTCSDNGACLSGPPNPCTGQTVGACAASCDEETGACDVAAPPVECTSPNNGWVFYIALAGPDGPKQARCVVYPDDPSAATVCALMDGNTCGTVGE